MNLSSELKLIKVGWYYETKTYRLTFRGIKTSWESVLTDRDPHMLPFQSQHRNIEPIYKLGADTFEEFIPAPPEPDPIFIPNPDDYTDEELEKIVAGKEKPWMIYHDSDKIAYYLATDAERSAWNTYAKWSMDDFNNNPDLDSYDSTDVYPGWNRSDNQTPWCPPKWFPEWLDNYRKKK